MFNFIEMICKGKKNFVTLQAEMKKNIKILFFLLFLTSCSPSFEVHRLQKELTERLSYADARIAIFEQAMQSNNIDSIRQVARTSQGVQFFIFDGSNIVYWSDNWLSAQSIKVTDDNDWCYIPFRNAHTVGKWSKAGDYHILTIVPMKYNYPFANRHFHNSFIAPFRGSDHWEVSGSPTDKKYALYSPSGTFLCSLVNIQHQEKEDTELNEFLSESFSYKTLLTETNMRVYYILTLAFFVIIILVGIAGLIKTRGLKNMRLASKLQYHIVALTLVCFVYIFGMSIRYVRRTNEQRQQTTLRKKCNYIQSALRNMYFWDIRLSPNNTKGLNIDLKDLSFAYETDINVYDLNGKLLGTSTPILFDRGVLSRHVPPEPFFSGKPFVSAQEHIGSLQYLVGYVPFYNGNYVPIGFIAVPSFVSHDEMLVEIDNYLSHLLPVYLIVFVLALLVSIWATRSFTRSLSRMATKMHEYRLGKEDNHIRYDNKDEVGELVDRYNELVDELEASARRLVRSEREGAWRTMARQVAHEINNPLTPMKLTIQQLQRTKGTERFDEYFTKSTSMLIQQIDNLSHIAQSFSTFAKMPEVKATQVDVAAKLSTVIDMFSNEPIPVRYIGPDKGVMALADEEQIAEVFTNIIKNAIQAMEGNQDGDVIVQLKQTEQGVEISISDNGPGIPMEIQDKIFTPNFTTKSSGSGLGLAISKNIVEGCDGSLQFKTSNKGTIFYIYLKKVRS